MLAVVCGDYRLRAAVYGQGLDKGDKPDQLLVRTAKQKSQQTAMVADLFGGGDDADRTRDLTDANRTLSHGELIASTHFVGCEPGRVRIGVSRWDAYHAGVAHKF